MMNFAPKILQDGAETFVKKRKVYGHSYTTHGRVMAALFPRGMALRTPNDFLRFSILNLIVIKIGRYCTHWEKPHQDSVHDIMVYSAVLEEVDQFFDKPYEEVEDLQKDIDIYCDAANNRS